MSNSIFQQQLQTLGFNIDTASFPFTKFRYPVAGLIFYLLTIILFSPDESKETTSDEKSKKKERFGKTKTVIFIHNMILCIFSILCFLNTFPPVYKVFKTYGWKDAVCHHFDTLYSESYGWWSYLFYLSKFYEFIDSWIVIARGRRPIFLQVFHHVGAVIGMWLIMITKCTGGFIFVVENSFIHSIMYFYYALSVLKIPIQSKFVITILQILQFIIGNTIAITQLIYAGSCMRFEDKFSIFYSVTYTFVLLYLFNQFYGETYKKKKE